MEIVENLEQWQAEFREGWLAHYESRGEIEWDKYPKIQNRSTPSGSGVDLSQSRLVLITSAGGYLKDDQAPFNAPDPLGDYGIRLFPSTTALDRIAYAHDHFDHTAVNQDPQVLLPLRHLAGMVADGRLGDLAPSTISFMGYQPDVGRVVNEMIPAIIKVAETEEVDAALLVPA